MNRLKPKQTLIKSWRVLSYILILCLNFAKSSNIPPLLVIKVSLSRYARSFIFGLSSFADVFANMEMYCTTSYAKTEVFISYIITTRKLILDIWMECITTEIHDYHQLLFRYCLSWNRTTKLYLSVATRALNFEYF